MGWPSASESEGTGFDSRLAQVIFSSLFGHVGITFSSIFLHVSIIWGSRFGHAGDTFSSFLEHVGMCFGTLWGGFRIGLGRFREKVPRRSKNQSFQICLGVFFLSRGAQNNCF